MATSEKWAMSSEQAKNYIVDPLTAPDPSDETGLNATFRSTFAPAPQDSSETSVNTRPGQVSGANVSTPVNTKRHSRGSPPTALEPGSGTRSRGNSLGQRYPGDMSHRPLDMLKKENHVAHKSHHLRKTSIPGVDSIDSLDSVPGGTYHHEGPYDATLLSRNTNNLTSPVAAVADSNNKALRATPAENIKDAIEGHRPLDGIATIPPGQSDRYGRTYNYEETNMVPAEVEAYQSGSDKADDEKNQAYELGSPGKGQATSVEMQDQPGHSRAKKSVEIREGEINEAEGSSTRHSLDGLKKRIGSLRRKKE